MNNTEKYRLAYKSLKALLEGETDLIANLSNVAAYLKQEFSFFWVGFYLVKNDQLVLGPFQGPVACTRIDYGKGVCGTAWKTKEAILVPNVHDFPGHIACSVSSLSEIVYPILKNNEVQMVLDIDSDQLDDFSEVDMDGIRQICHLISETI